MVKADLQLAKITHVTRRVTDIKLQKVPCVPMKIGIQKLMLILMGGFVVLLMAEEDLTVMPLKNTLTGSAFLHIIVF